MNPDREIYSAKVEFEDTVFNYSALENVHPELFIASAQIFKKQ